jgi:hypothetical protein
VARNQKAKFRAQRIDSGYVRRSHPFRAWRTWLTLVALVLSGSWVAPMFVERHPEAASPGPVASAHAMFDTRCEKCHLDPTAEQAEASPMKARFDRLIDWHEPDDRACKACHPNMPAHQVSEHGTPRCIDCHLEHRSAADLSAMTIARCTSCHSNLGAHMEGSPKVVGLDEGRLGVQIDAFVLEDGAVGTAHPEFAVWTDTAGGPRRPRLGAEPAPVDPTTLTFSHKEHLAEICGPPGHPRNVGYKVKLECGDCHAATAKPLMPPRADAPERKDKRSPRPWDFGSEPPGFSVNSDPVSAPAEEGAYLAPVRYQQHCAGCHPHNVADMALAGIDTDNCDPIEARDDVPSNVPHDEPAVVRAFLWGLYSRKVTDPKALDRFPRFRPVGEGATVDTELAPADKVASKVRDAEKVLYTDKKRCQFCHEVQWPDRDRLPVIARTLVPIRWLPHGRFDHGLHRMVSCAECHGDVANVETAEEVMLPRKETCAKCHNPELASDACSTCHTYHGAVSPFDMDGGLKIDDIATGQ